MLDLVCIQKTQFIDTPFPFQQIGILLATPMFSCPGLANDKYGYGHWLGYFAVIGSSLLSFIQS